MVKQAMIVLCFLMSFSLTQAQNWRPIQQQAVKTYYRILNEPQTPVVALAKVHNQSNTQIVALEIDTMIIESGDSAFYFYDNNYVEEDSAYLFFTHFLQEKMVQRSGGIYDFINPNQFSLQTLAPLNHRWEFNTQTGDSATVVEFKQDTVLGQLDSIKVIALDSGDSLVLSQNYGIVSFQAANGKNYELLSIDQVNHQFVGKEMPNNYNINNYNVGDVFYYYRYENSSAFGRGEYTRRYEITSKQISNDSFFYDVDVVEMAIGLPYNQPPDTNITVSTTNWVRTFSPYDVGHGKLGCLGASCQRYRWEIFEDASGKFYYVTNINYQSTSPFTGTTPVVTPLFISEHVEVFEPYVGLLYLSHNSWSIVEEELIGSVINGVVWGDTTVLDGIVSTEKIETLSNILTVSPNPVKDQLLVQLSGDYAIQTDIVVQVFNLQGQEVLQRVYTPSTDITINMENLEAGCYVLSVLAGGEQVTQKIVKIL